MKLKIHTFTLPLIYPFKISHDARTQQETVIVELEYKGIKGYGEATITPYYKISVDSIKEQLFEIEKNLPKDIIYHPKDFWNKMNPLIERKNNFAICALDVALWDLWGKMHGKKLVEIWDLPLNETILTNYTIGIDTIEEMKKKVLENPFPIYKIKLGTENDLEIVEELRKITDAAFRVDPNTSWTAEQTIAYTPILKDLGVEFIEQPLKPEDWEGMKKLRDKTELPIIADESCQTLEDIKKCAEVFDGVNIKLMKSGGITPAINMIYEARKLNLKVMVGCMTESTIGCSAIAQLLPLLDYVDVDGCILVKDTISTGIKIDQGKIIFSSINGIGANLL